MFSTGATFTFYTVSDKFKYVTSRHHFLVPVAYGTLEQYIAPSIGNIGKTEHAQLVELAACAEFFRVSDIDDFGQVKLPIIVTNSP